MAVTHRVDTNFSPSVSFFRGLIMDVCPPAGVSESCGNRWLDDLFSFGFPESLVRLIQVRKRELLCEY
jgi:hypothetical protein